MRTVVINPPTPAVTWEDADAHLRLEGDSDQQAYVESLIAAAQAHIDGPSGWLGRAIGVQTLEARFSLPSCGSIRLPYPPVLELLNVKYLNYAGDEITANLSDFELFGADLGPKGASWPWLGGSMQREAGRLQYRAGYSDVPAPIKAAILLMVGDLFHSRATVATGAAMTSVPMTTTVNALLSPYRVYS